MKGAVNVLQIVDRLGMGGAETWLMEILRLWSRTRAARLDFLATGGGPGLFDEEARELGARIHYVPYRRNCLARFALEFRRVLREGRYDAVHDHQDYASGWHFLMGSRALPSVRLTHVHNPAYQIRNNYAVTVSRRITASIGKALVARYATHIVGTSRQVITEYGFDEPRFSQIKRRPLYCGLDPARFVGDVDAAKASICFEFGWPKDAKIILFAGRIDKSPDPGDPQNHKNSGFAVSIAIECARRSSGTRALFVGALTEPAVATLQKRIADAGLSRSIRFTGIRRDINRLMLGSDVLLFPSRSEGLGMVAVEAQAAGLPVLASTAVPRECVVVPELVRFQRLDAGVGHWVEDLLYCIEKPRCVTTANDRVAASPFAIQNSADALSSLYRGGSFVD